MKLSDWEYIYRKNRIEIIPKVPVKRPEYFYKYYSITAYNIEAVLNSEFYFSHPLILNDLFESSIQMIKLDRITQDELVNLYYKYQKVIWDHLDDKDYHSIKHFVNEGMKNNKKEEFLRMSLTFYWNIIFIKSGVLSLSGVDNNILLWSYYTNHTGFAVELNSLPMSGVEIFGPYPVNYTDKYETLYPKTAALNNEHLLYLTSIKSVDWQHEREWRLLLIRENLSIPDYSHTELSEKSRLVKYSREIINSIILGFKFFKEFIPYEVDGLTYRYTINELADKNNLELKIKLLNYLVDNNLLVKQIRTTEDNTFSIEAGVINIEIIDRDKTYLVRRSRENKKANLRLK